MKVAKVLFSRLTICSHNSCQSAKFKFEHVAEAKKLDEIFGSCERKTATTTSGHSNFRVGSWLQDRRWADEELVVVVHADGVGEL